MRISDWSSDVCSSDLLHLVAGDVRHRVNRQLGQLPNAEAGDREEDEQDRPACADGERNETCNHGLFLLARALAELGLEQECILSCDHLRSEEHTSELQSLMRTSYAVFCLKKTTSSTANTDN